MKTAILTITTRNQEVCASVCVFWKVGSSRNKVHTNQCKHKDFKINKNIIIWKLYFKTSSPWKKSKKKKVFYFKEKRQKNRGKRNNAFACDFLYCFLTPIQPGIWIPVNTTVCIIELCFVASLPSMMFVFHTFYFQDDYLVFITDIFHIFIWL